ncbi:hypothetical protein FH972_010598 [Carpinus fangiana]|uniref:Uncharacterized protein n=1 Tax=Carpinus fangiana TaxID=176857 RepID=A0A660KNT3_9ROSI|nr:hypothetical protein FH972_010598 [Carpinus fangiana]
MARDPPQEEARNSLFPSRLSLSHILPLLPQTPKNATQINTTQFCITAITHALGHTTTKIQRKKTVWEREIKEEEHGGANSKGEGQPIEAQILVLIFNPVASLKEKSQKDEL